MSGRRRPPRTAGVGWERLPDAQVHGTGLTVHATGDPDRPAVVFLHGLEDSWSSWEPLVAHLRDGYRCYAVELPWRAGGDYHWRDRGTGSWIAGALEAIDRRPVALVAHSFSANAILQRIANREDLRADALVLISPFYRPPSVPVDWRTFDRSLHDFRTTMTAGLRLRLGTRADRLEPDVFDLMAQAMLDRIGVAGFLAVFDQFAAASGMDLSHHRAPVLVIAGSYDPGIAGERADWLGRAIPHARMHVDPAYSHFCHLEQPELVGPLVADFLRTATRSGSAQEGTAYMPTIEGTTSAYTGRPRYEGANISTFIGFKNFMMLAEDAVLAHLRGLGYGPQALFERYGLGLTIVHSSVRLTATMHADDLVVGSVTAPPAKPGSAAGFDVRLAARRGDGDVRLLAGKVRVALVAEKEGTPLEPVPDALAAFVVPEVGGGDDRLATPADGDPAALAARSGNDFLWSWKIPYFACHYYTRVQHSTYVKLLEEAVDRYLEHVRLPITGLLAQRDWIPVVSRASVTMHADAYMGETLLITFKVDDVIKDTLFTAQMECHVRRGGELVRTASATIMHGYVTARGARAFTDLVVLDEATQAALLRADRATMGGAA